MNNFSKRDNMEACPKENKDKTQCDWQREVSNTDDPTHAAAEHQGFDFNSIEVTDYMDEFEDQFNAMTHSEYTDAIWYYYKNHNASMIERTRAFSKIERDGYFSCEEAFYSLQPFDYLPGCSDYCYQREFIRYGYLFLTVGFDEKLDSIEIDEKSCADYRPVVVFRHHRGDMLNSLTLEQQEEYHCKNDTMVFEGIFSAVAKAPGIYDLHRISKRLYIRPWNKQQTDLTNLNS